MKWDEVCKDTLLQDLPYKVELNETKTAISRFLTGREKWTARTSSRPWQPGLKRKPDRG